MSPCTLFQNKILRVNVALWIVSIMLFLMFRKPWLLFLVFYMFFVNEIIFWMTGKELIYDCYSRTELAYSLGSIDCFLPSDVQQIHPNMTEGYFPADDAANNILSLDAAEQNRFDHFIKLLGISEGDWVLDCGCGHGGLVHYLRQKGFHAEGITICPTQHENNTRKCGPYFHRGNYTEFMPQLAHKFDVIILPGSLEHPFGGNVACERAYVEKSRKMSCMFKMMKKYFRPSSPYKKILTTCLHMNIDFKNTWEAWFIERTFGGLYPSLELPVSASLREAGFQIIMERDYTWHYYMASVCDVNHFGNPVDWSLSFTSLLSVFYPPALYAYWYNKKGLWAWQFDGKHHQRRTTSMDHDLTFQQDSTKRPTTLLYTLACLSN